MRIFYNGEPSFPRRALRPNVAGGIVWYHFPGRWVLYGRRYVIPRNPGTRSQVHMRQLLGALSRDWFALLTLPQRDAWNRYARKFNRRWGQAWTDRARQLRCCPPHTWTDADRHILRRCRFGYRPLSGQQIYVKLNGVLGRIGRAKLLWPPPLPLPFQPNPIEGVRITWECGRPRIELVLARPVKGDLLVFASAPCSAGWSKLRHPVYLGLPPAPHHGISDITALYLARFGALTPNQKVFIRTRLHRHGWEIATADHSALVPPKPSPIQPPGYLPPHTPCTRETGTSPAIYAPRRHPALFSVAADHPRCPQFVSIREIRVCPRRKSHWRHLWRGN